MNKSQYKIGVDLGGTKIEILLLDSSDRVLLRKRISTPRGMKNEYQLILFSVYELIKDALKAIPLIACHYSIGIGIPGTYEHNSEKVINSNTVSLIGKSFKKDLEDLLGHPIGIENDANCFSIAEATWGAARGYRTVFGIILGSGCGGGIVIDGKIHKGRNSIAGEWGHFSVDPFGEPCFCGKRGCIETKLSGHGVARIHHKKFNENIDFESILTRFRDGDNNCRHTIETFLDDFGRCVGGMISILDPDAIVIGGGISNMDEIYTTGSDLARRYALYENPTTPILRPQLGDSAGVFGAAWIGVLNSYLV